MDILGTKKLFRLLEEQFGIVIPQTEEALAAATETLTEAGVFLEEAGDLVEDIEAFVAELKDAPEWVKLALREAAKMGNVGHRVLLRAGNTMSGLFPLTIEWTPSQPKSPLGALLAGADGEPGSIILKFVPAHIPG